MNAAHQQDLSRFFMTQTFEKTRLDVERATTLPPEMYRNRDFHPLEQDRVFKNSWVCVGYASELSQPGQTICATVAGDPIVVVKTKSQEIKAFFNVCRHRGSLLVKEAGKIERFRCPYHSWTYDLDGRLQSCPLFKNTTEHAGFDKDEYHLLPVRTEVWGCFIFVNLSNTAEPLNVYLGDLALSYQNFPLKDLVLYKRKKYSINANWKLVAENFLEYYHLPWVHPELCDITPIDLHRRNQGSGMYLSFFASPLGQRGTPIDAQKLRYMPGLTEHEQMSGYFPMIFPNVAMFLLPHHLFAIIMFPRAIDQTEEYGDILVHPDTLSEPNAEEKLDAMFAFYDMVNMQDIEAVELVQRGIAAKAYPGGRMCFRFEEPVHRFQNMIIDFLTNERRTYPRDPDFTITK